MSITWPALSVGTLLNYLFEVFLNLRPLLGTMGVEQY
jgi:hypothetical protein